MTALNEQFEKLKYYHSAFQKRFAQILLRELTNKEHIVPDKELIVKKMEFIQEYSPIYFEVINQKFSSIYKIETLFLEFSKASHVFQDQLTLIFTKSFEKLETETISWEYELDIEPANRYLLIQDKIAFPYPENIDFLKRELYKNFPDQAFECLKQEFSTFLSDKDNKNLLSVGISYSYANITLPKCYEIIFDRRDTTKFWEQKVIVKYAFNYRNFFHTDLWRGHHSHCLLEIIGDIPAIFDELPTNDQGSTLHKGIGLCTKYDWQYIKNEL